MKRKEKIKNIEDLQEQGYFNNDESSDSNQKQSFEEFIRVDAQHLQMQ